MAYDIYTTVGENKVYSQHRKSLEITFFSTFFPTNLFTEKDVHLTEHLTQFFGSFTTTSYRFGCYTQPGESFLVLIITEIVKKK